MKDLKKELDKILKDYGFEDYEEIYFHNFARSERNKLIKQILPLFSSRLGELRTKIKKQIKYKKHIEYYEAIDDVLKLIDKMK